MFRRDITILKTSSYFLFGARGTGKSTFLKQQFSSPGEAIYIDLLLPSEFDPLVRRPESLLERIEALPPNVEWIVLDEVQKIPELLDLVQHAMLKYKIKFALSGSSARKLRRGGANLLAGRAFVYNLFPLTSGELGEKFQLETALNFGTLPGIYALETDVDRREFLAAYAHTYVREEVIAEQVLRALPPFRRFLEIAAQMNGEPVNHAKIARDVGVDDKTVKNYYSVLEDTLIGFHLESYHKSVRKTQTQAPRFYFFDPGVKRGIEGTLHSRIVPRTYAFGKAFEHFVITEIHRLNSYRRTNYRCSFLRTQAGVEVDLILDRAGDPPIFIEIKSAEQMNTEDVHKIESITNDVKDSKTLLLSLDPHAKIIGRTKCVHWRAGLAEIGLAG
ncbi:MAG: ATP-binding protein [Planctomycetes bacterium]|nr:ATP-binding protein [Planctomycetota bacterium]